MNQQPSLLDFDPIPGACRVKTVAMGRTLAAVRSCWRWAQLPTRDKCASCLSFFFPAPLTLIEQKRAIYKLPVIRKVK